MTHHRPLWPFADVPRRPVPVDLAHSDAVIYQAAAGGLLRNGPHADSTVTIHEFKTRRPAASADTDPRHAPLGNMRPSPALPAPSALTAQDAELAYGWRAANDVPPWATEDAQDQYLLPYSQLDAALPAPPTSPEPREQNMTPQPQKTIRSLIDELKALKQRMQDEGAGGILQLLQDEVFSKYPEVKALAWTQYTPYYCDGESCEFGVNAYGTPRIRALSAAECDEIGLDFIVGEASPGPLDDIRAAVKNDASDSELMALIKCIKPADTDSDSSSDEDDEPEFDTDSYFTEDSSHGMRYDDARRGIDAIIDSIPDELMEIVFGDHVRVYACPTGIATAEYEHE